MEILIPVSVGELFDKISVLRIKQERITDSAAKLNVEHELSKLVALEPSRIGLTREDNNQVKDLIWDLECINKQIWDNVAEQWRNERMDKQVDWTQLSRNVLLGNDKRARIKRELNDIFGSSIIEEKQR